jgi:hypothetical protein
MLEVPASDTFAEAMVSGAGASCANAAIGAVARIPSTTAHVRADFENCLVMTFAS